MDFAQMALFWGLPTAVTGFFFWLVQRKITKQAAEREKIDAEREQKALEREKHREKLILMILQSYRAGMRLSEATARAVQRIPDARCNGDMTKALEDAQAFQIKQKDFLMELGVHSIYD